MDDWTIDAPAIGTRQPLMLRFPEILDRALLSSTITLVDGMGAQVHGSIDVGVEERTWTLTPDRQWCAGASELRVSSELEDVAGNSLRRLFDAEMTSAVAPNADVPAIVTRSFTVR